MRMFEFDPAEHARQFASEGFVHIRAGVSNDFHRILEGQVDEFMERNRLQAFAIGDKQQALYEFPKGGDHLAELKAAVAGVCGFAASDLVLSERHIKAYEHGAVPLPLAHKDRFASEVAVGLSVRVPDGSTLVLYPYDELEVNPFNSSTELRASMMPDRAPEAALRSARRVEINDAPRDVIIFRGHRIWHLREHGADSTMLYLKLNTLNCDPLAEDPTTAECRRLTTEALGLDDTALAAFVPRVGRRVDYVQRRSNRDWREVIAVMLWGESAFVIDEDELKAMRAMDGTRDVRALATSLGRREPDVLLAVRRLGRRGAVDLFPPS